MRFASLTLEAQRAAVEHGMSPVGPDVAVAEVDAGGVPCEWITAPGADADLTLVALRGGGYCLGSLVSNRRFCALLSEVTSARVLNVGYRNAPEHRFPAALDDAVGAYRWLRSTGADPGAVALVGNRPAAGWSSPRCSRCATPATRCRRRRSPSRRGPTSP